MGAFFAAIIIMSFSLQAWSIRGWAFPGKRKDSERHKNLHTNKYSTALNIFLPHDST
jgi:hypothetical protein